MKAKEELYLVRVKGEQRGGLTIYDDIYVLGQMAPQWWGLLTTVKSISLLKDKITIHFENGHKLITGYDPQRVDLFYQPIKTEES